MDLEHKGRRVRLLHTSDQFTELRPGDLGTVEWADDIGTVHVRWDGGSGLGMVPGEDRWEFID